MSLAKKLGSAALALVLGSALALGPVAAALHFDAAQAQGKSGDRGNGGNGKDKDRGSSNGKSDRGNSQGNGKPLWANQQGGPGGGKATAPGQVKRQESTQLASQDLTVEPEVEKKGRGSIASQMGALNAAHANPQAFANASPNSRVGRIAAYRDAVLGAETSDDRYDAVFEYLDGLDGSESAQDIYDGAYAALVDSGLYTEEELADLLAAAEADDADAALAELEALEGEAEGEVITKEDALGLLDEAANKEVTDEVIEAVNALLGIEFPEEWTEEAAALGEEEGEAIVIIPEG